MKVLAAQELYYISTVWQHTHVDSNITWTQDIVAYAILYGYQVVFDSFARIGHNNSLSEFIYPHPSDTHTK